MNSILNSTKRLVAGLEPDDDSFDVDMIMHINTVFSILTQLGVGPEDGFSISDDSKEWNEYTNDNKKVEMVKSYVAAKVRLLFDPPTSSTVKECIKQTIDELEWRLKEEYEFERKGVT